MTNTKDLNSTVTWWEKVTVNQARMSSPTSARPELTTSGTYDIMIFDTWYDDTVKTEHVSNFSFSRHNCQFVFLEWLLCVVTIILEADNSTAFKILLATTRT